MNSYFLIARDRKDNTFTVVKLREDWYLGRDKGRSDVFTRENSLEAIDLVTSRFSSEQEMADRMAANGYIPTNDVDIFVADRSEKNGKTYIKFYEAIYNLDKSKRVSALRGVARTSLTSNQEGNSQDLGIIYDDLISLAYTADDYLEMLLEGCTNVPRSFGEKLRGIKGYADIPYHLKSSESFGTDSYTVIRNIVESINRMQTLGGRTGDERFDSNSLFVEKNLSNRMAIIPELSIQLDKDYVEGQLSLFSSLDEEDKKKVQKATEEIVKEEKLIPAKIKIDRSLSKEEKRKEIFRVLRHVPKNTIYREKGTNNFKVNYDLFDSYPIVDESEKKKLDTYLTGNLPEYIARYIWDYRFLCDAQKGGYTPNSEIYELQMDVEYDIRRIDNRFKSSKCLNMVYEWCKVLEGALQRNVAVRDGAKVIDDAEEKPKTYGKKQ